MATTDIKGRKGEWLSELVGLMAQFEWDMLYKVTLEGRLPDEWKEIWETRGRAQTRVTVRVDTDVLKFFRAMGDGYGPRMNAVLRAFMLSQLSGIITEDKLPEQYRERWMGKPRPQLKANIAELAASMGKDPDRL